MNLQTTFDLDIKSFFLWWGRELTFLIPQKLRQLLSDRSGSLVFTVAERGFNVVFFREAAGDEPVFSRFIDSVDRETYQNLKNQHADLDKADVVLRLGAEHAINKIIHLPAAALENLQQVVGFELDRYTPFKPEQVYFSAVPMGKTEQGQLRVMLVLTPRVILDEQLALLGAWDVQPNRVAYQPLNASYPELDGQYNLLPERYRPRTSRLAQSVHWLLSGVLLILLLAVMVYPVWQEKQVVDLLKNQIKELEKQTRVVDEQQLEIDALRDETQRLIDIKHQTPEMVAVLNELSHLLKDDTWLTNLRYSENHMQIQGQSPAASALIGLLEASPFFSKVSFVSPLTQDKATGMERFQISMDVSAMLPDAGQSEPPQEPEAPAEESVEPEQTDPAAPAESAVYE
jgi:general secretion pathway protein L